MPTRRYEIRSCEMHPYNCPVAEDLLLEARLVVQGDYFSVILLVDLDPVPAEVGRVVSHRTFDLPVDLDEPRLVVPPLVPARAFSLRLAPDRRPDTKRVRVVAIHLVYGHPLVMLARGPPRRFVNVRVALELALPLEGCHPDFVATWFDTATQAIIRNAFACVLVPADRSELCFRPLFAAVVHTCERGAPRAQYRRLQCSQGNRTRCSAPPSAAAAFRSAPASSLLMHPPPELRRCAVFRNQVCGSALGCVEACKRAWHFASFPPRFRRSRVLIGRPAVLSVTRVVRDLAANDLAPSVHFETTLPVRAAAFLPYRLCVALGLPCVRHCPTHGNHLRHRTPFAPSSGVHTLRYVPA